MSAKAIKKYGDIKVPCASLQPGDKEGYLTKVGGSVKTWKKRYFVLKDRTLYYYKTPKDVVFTGKVDLEPNSLVKEETGKKKPNLFSITTSKRVFYMHPLEDKEKGVEVMRSWIEAISRGIEKAKALGAPGGGAPPQQPNGSTSAAPASNGVQGSSDTGAASNNNVTNGNAGASSSAGAASNNNTAPSVTSTPTTGSTDVTRARLASAKDAVRFLKDEESKVLEFWQIWSESIPSRDELTAGMSIDFVVAASADMQKLTWRTSGPQNIFIQKMVDFFWNVGAPESEIDRLNDVGAQINPHRIGSWIDMSAKGGMDGGWFFPTDMTLAVATSAADEGRAVTQFVEWAESKPQSVVLSVGRDMGAAPPRQTEIRLKLPGSTAQEQFAAGLDAFTTFGFPAIPEESLAIFKKTEPNSGMILSVITSSEGFVRLGLLAPRPSRDTVRELCLSAGGNHDELQVFERALQSDGPAYVEFQVLMKGFGYGVYKEGFDVVFHYNAGTEEL